MAELTRSGETTSARADSRAPPCFRPFHFDWHSSDEAPQRRLKWEWENIFDSLSGNVSSISIIDPTPDDIRFGIFSSIFFRSEALKNSRGNHVVQSSMCDRTYFYAKPTNSVMNLRIAIDSEIIMKKKYKVQRLRLWCFSLVNQDKSTMCLWWTSSLAFSRSMLVVRY